MLSAEPNDRSERRYFITLPAVIRTHPEDPHTHVGLIRDLSEHGMFFYSGIKPAIGSVIGFAFTLAKPAMEPVFVSGTGEVIRVVQPAPGAAIGVAVRVQQYDTTALPSLLADTLPGPKHDS